MEREYGDNLVALRGITPLYGFGFLRNGPITSDRDVDVGWMWEVKRTDYGTDFLNVRKHACPYFVLEGFIELKKKII
jgi:hypothetical protein